jgi:hypothetical protein
MSHPDKTNLFPFLSDEVFEVQDGGEAHGLRDGGVVREKEEIRGETGRRLELLEGLFGWQVDIGRSSRKSLTLLTQCRIERLVKQIGYLFLLRWISVLIHGNCRYH